MRAYFTGPTFPSVDPVSAALSTVTVGDGTLDEGESTLLTLTVLRRSGNPWTESTLTVVFTETGGTSDGVISEPVHQGSGVYTATYFALTAGSATSIGATVDGVAITSVLPTITVAALDAYDPYGISPNSFAWDDFTGWADTAALQAGMPPGASSTSKYSSVVANQVALASINTSILFNGHQTMEYAYLEQSANACQPHVYFNQPPNGGGGGSGITTRGDVWLRYRVRYTPGFSINGNGGSPPGNPAASYKSWFLGWQEHNSRAEIEYISGGGINFQILATNIGTHAVTVSATALAGATTLLVNALTRWVYSGHVLGFGGGIFATVAVTAPQGATSITTNALAADVVSGSVANPQSPNSTIAFANHTAVGVGTMWTDGLFYEYISRYRTTDPIAKTWLFEYWYHPAGTMVPVKRASLTGGVAGIGPMPTFAYFKVGGNFNRTRAIGENLYKQWGSWEIAAGVDANSNPFNIPAGSL